MVLLMPNVDKRTWNVVWLGVCFMILFAADFTITNMQKTIISSIEHEKPHFKLEGYATLGLVYTVFAITLWFSPAMISLIDPKTALILAAIGYSVYIFSFIAEEVWATYVGMVVGGFSAGILWPAEGNYLVLNSQPLTVTLHIGIFWAFFSSSSLFGNMYAYYEFEGKQDIDRETRRHLILLMGALSIVSVISLCFLPSIKGNELIADKKNSESPRDALKVTWSIFTSKNMLLLSISFFYTGLQQAFGHGIYSACLGFTLQFGIIAKQLVPLSGLIYGAGDFFGGLCQMFLGKKLASYTYGRILVILVGVCVQMSAYIIISINIPDAAVFSNTTDKAIIQSSVCLALVCSALLGIGDSCLNVQNFSIIAALFPDNSAQSCALYKFIKSISVAIGFYCSSHIGLHIQMLVLASFCIIHLVAYYIVDNKIRDESLTNDLELTTY